jgi:hypothetical protein
MHACSLQGAFDETNGVACPQDKHGLDHWHAAHLLPGKRTLYLHTYPLQLTMVRLWWR